MLFQFSLFLIATNATTALMRIMATARVRAVLSPVGGGGGEHSEQTEGVQENLFRLA
jgi:hypothetical protein